MDTWVVTCSYLTKKDIVSLFYINQWFSTLTEKKEIWYYCLPNRCLQFIVTTENWHPQNMLRDIATYKEQTSASLMCNVLDKIQCKNIGVLEQKVIIFSVVIARGEIELMKAIFYLFLFMYEETKNDIYFKKTFQYYSFLLQEKSNPLMKFNYFEMLQQSKKYQWEGEEEWMLEGILHNDGLCFEHYYFS